MIKGYKINFFPVYKLPTRIGLDGARNSGPKFSCLGPFKEFWLKKAEGCWGRIKPKDKKKKEIHDKVKVVGGTKNR
jgi:hypothetical protein